MKSGELLVEDTLASSCFQSPWRKELELWGSVYLAGPHGRVPAGSYLPDMNMTVQSLKEVERTPDILSRQICQQVLGHRRVFLTPLPYPPIPFPRQPQSQSQCCAWRATSTDRCLRTLCYAGVTFRYGGVCVSGAPHTRRATNDERRV